MIGLTLLAAAALPAAEALLPGVFTNEEQVYFAKEEGKPVPQWTGVRVTAEDGGYRLQPVDAFSAAAGAPQMLSVREGAERTHIRSGACVRDFARVPAGMTIVNRIGRCDDGGITTVTDRGIAMTMADGTVIEMQRARVFKCWASIPRRALKDGKPDWWFKAGLMLHDAGGRVEAVTDEAVPQRFVLRMRNVAWPTGTNKPSLVLYIHGDDPDRAIGYGWADPAARLIGLNLRNVQASCSLPG